MLQTVITFRSAPLPPWLLTCSTSHSPPHFDISLFLPTSSASICFASAMSSCAIVWVSLPASISTRSFLDSLRVAAPRFTAVGRAVKRCARSSDTCCFSASVVSSQGGVGEAFSALLRWFATASAAREAIAGAPRI